MLGTVVAEAAERFGDATAFVDPDGGSLTYRQLHVITDEVAAGLLDQRMGEASVLAISLPPSLDYVVAYVAAAKIGAITAGVNHKLTATERDAVLERAQPALVIDSDHNPVADLAVPGGAPRPLPPHPDRVVAIVFTSGTTGAPKGAVFANRQLSFITEVDTGGRWGGGGHTMASTSLAHLGPTTKLPGNLMRGGTIHLMERWRATTALELIDRHRMAGIGGIPTQFALMLANPAFASFDLTCVQAVVIGGGPASPVLVRQIRERFGAALAMRYSCTEAGVGLGTAFTDPPEDAEESVGRPHPGVTLTIVDPDSDVVRPDGQEGEVCLRSPAVMRGYWNDPKATAAAFLADGSVRTGDLGVIDDRGRLHLVGRRTERYVRGGYNVHPQEVETALAAHPDVSQVAVVSIPDLTMGEIGVAYVVPKDGGNVVDLAVLRAFATDMVAGYKLPDRLVLLDSLPLTAMDKVDKRELARRAAGQLDTSV